MKRVLILHISQFGGHSKAAENIKEALSYRDPRIRAITLNGFGYFYPRGEKIVDFIYTSVIKHMPYLWGKIYDRPKVAGSLSLVRRLVHKMAFRKLSRLIHNFNPNCVVATQAFPCGLLADFKEEFGLNIPLIAVVTDYHPHRFWLHPGIDIYTVACQEAKETLMEQGIAEEKIKILGIPISVKFLTANPKDKIARRYGFSPSATSVLIMGGGLGIGPIEEIALQLDEINADIQIIAVCGKNKRLYHWFERNKYRFTKPLFFFGYVDFMHVLMDFSDIIITKAGGITVSEALAKGMAMVIIDPIPGQEERNVEYLARQEAAIMADTPVHVCQEVQKLLDDKKRMFSLREKAKAVSVMDSSLRLVDLIEKFIG